MLQATKHIYAICITSTHFLLRLKELATATWVFHALEALAPGSLSVVAAPSAAGTRNLKVISTTLGIHLPSIYILFLTNQNDQQVATNG